MPKWSGVTFSVQPVEYRGKVSGYVVAGYLSKGQLEALRYIVDSPEYQRSKKWRGEYQDLAKAITSSIDKATK